MLASLFMFLTLVSSPAPVPSTEDAIDDPRFRSCMALRLGDGDVARIARASEELPLSSWDALKLETPCVFVGGVELEGQRYGYAYYPSGFLVLTGGEEPRYLRCTQCPVFQDWVGSSLD